MFTPIGFFSITKRLDEEKGSRGKVCMQIRARDRNHLIKLIQFGSKHKIWVGRPSIVSDVGTDYPYRIYATRDELSELMHEFSQSIDYSNFKNECGRRQRSSNNMYTSVLDKIWHLGLQLEEQSRDAFRWWRY